MMSLIKRLIYQGPSLSLALRELRFNSPQGKNWWNDLGKFAQTVNTYLKFFGFIVATYIRRALMMCSNPHNRISLLLMTLRALEGEVTGSV